MPVAFSALALQDVVKADIWWRENRDAKDLFSDEVSAAILLLEGAPRVGQRIKGRSPKAEEADRAPSLALPHLLRSR